MFSRVDVVFFSHVTVGRPKSKQPCQQRVIMCLYCRVNVEDGKNTLSLNCSFNPLCFKQSESSLRKCYSNALQLSIPSSWNQLRAIEKSFSVKAILFIVIVFHISY